MKKNFLFQLLLAAFLLPAFSCSDDDSAPEINNATTLNMLDVENGATRLGNSDIYINAANNFQTNECLIAEIGPSKGIGKVIPPQVGNGLVYQAAVTPGHLYQAFKEEAVKQFPSGKFALALAGDYYQFYVGSEIMKEEKRVGAVIQFALINPEADGLPAYDSTIGTVVSGYEDEIVREFPKDTEFSYDSDLEDLFQITTEGGILKVTLLPSWSDIRGNYAIYARHNEVYTKISETGCRQIAESAGLDKRERFLDGLFRFPSRYRRFYRRGARFSPRQYLDRGCLDVSRKGDPILGLDGICL